MTTSGLSVVYHMTDYIRVAQEHDNTGFKGFKIFQDTVLERRKEILVNSFVQTSACYTRICCPCGREIINLRYQIDY